LLSRLLKDSSIYAISGAISRGVAIILIPLYTRYLHPIEYGVLDLLMIAATLANYLVSLEISQGLARVYSEAKSDVEKNSCVSSAAWFVVLSYCLFALVGLSFSSSIAQLLLDSIEWTSAVQTMIIAVVANGIFFLLQDLLRWQLRPKLHALSSISYSFVSAGVGSVAVVIADMGVVGLLVGQIAGAFIGLCVTCINGAATHWGWRFDKSRWIEMFSYSAPMIISSVASYSALYIDRIFIKEMISVEEVGIYGVGARIASIVALLMAGFQSGFIPLVFQNHASRETPVEMARAFRYFLVGAFVIMLFLTGFSKELLWLFTTPQYFEAWYTIPILATAMLLANMYIFVPGVFIARRTGLVAIINVSVAILNVGCLFLLVPHLGIAGAAVATLISALISFLIYTFINLHFYPIPFAWPQIIKGTGVALLCSFGLMLLQFTGVAWDLIYKTPLFLIAVVLAAYCLLETSELAQIASKLRLKNL